MFPLRLRPDAEVQYGPVTTMEICIRNETHYILAKREIELLIRRQALETTSCLDRNLEFEYIPIEDYERVKRHDPFTVKTDPASLKGYEKAETEAMEMMEKYFNTNPAIGFSEVKFMPNHLWTSERGRGLEQSVYKSIEYCRGSYLPALMRCCTKLNELGPANVDDDPALIMGPSTERENSVQKAREEIQGVLEWFSSQEVDQRQLLNRGSTNLLEPWAGGGYCEYCNLEHRNGDCLLSWDPVV